MSDLRLKSKSFFRCWPLFLITFVVSLFFWKFFFQGQIPLPADFMVGTYYPWLDYKWGFATGIPVKNPITTDVVSFTYPMRLLAIKLLKSGSWPLWNPYIFTGIPLLANFQSAPFTPTNLFYFLFDDINGWSMQVIFQHFAAATTTFALLRRWKVSRFGSVMGGIVFAFSGFNLIWSQWNAHTLSASYIPLILLFQDKWLKKPKATYGVLLSFVFLLQILAGYPQIIFYTGCAALLLWLFNFRNNRSFILRSIFMGIFFILGLGLGWLQISPALELLSYSQRAIEPLEFSWAFLPWSKVITFIAPDFFGNHSTQNYWGPTDYTTTTGFVGVVALGLALGGVQLLRRKVKPANVKFSLILIFVSLILAFPTPLSIAIWKSGLFGFQAASAHRALVLFNLGIALLSAFGFDALFGMGRNFKTRYLLAVPLVLILTYGLYVFTLLKLPNIFGVASLEPWKLTVAARNLVFPTFVLSIFSTALLIIRLFRLSRLFTFIIIFTLLVLELFRFGWKFTPFSPRHIVYPNTPVMDFLQSQKKPMRVTSTGVIPINMKMAYELESLEGYDAIYPVEIAKFIAVLNSENLNASPQGRYGTVSNIHSDLLAMTNTKYILTLKHDNQGRPSEVGSISSEFDSHNYEIAFQDKTTVVIEDKKAMPRAFMVYDWKDEAQDEEMLDELLDLDDFSERLLLGEDIIFRSDGAVGDYDVHYSEYLPQRSRLIIETSKDGLLFVSDLYYPGWKAKLDGIETDIYKTNYAFRSVWVPRGVHEVTFEYKPKSFQDGLTVSAVSLFTLIVFSLCVDRLVTSNLLVYNARVKHRSNPK